MVLAVSATLLTPLGNCRDTTASEGGRLLYSDLKEMNVELFAQPKHLGPLAMHYAPQIADSDRSIVLHYANGLLSYSKSPVELASFFFELEPIETHSSGEAAARSLESYPLTFGGARAERGLLETPGSIEGRYGKSLRLGGEDAEDLLMRYFITIECGGKSAHWEVVFGFAPANEACADYVLGTRLSRDSYELMVSKGISFEVVVVDNDGTVL